jgi:hypothetical protein
MKLSFQVICSAEAAAALSESELQDLVDEVIPLALEKDRGVHEGLTFSFDRYGQEWMMTVDLQQGWVKFMGKDEYEKAVREAVQKN